MALNRAKSLPILTMPKRRNSRSIFGEALKSPRRIISMKAPSTKVLTVILQAVIWSDVRPRSLRPLEKNPAKPQSSAAATTAISPWVRLSIQSPRMAENMGV